MKKVLCSIYRLYADGFRQMTWGKQLWWLIILKLVLLFVVLRVFFFKPAMAGLDEKEKIEVVVKSLTPDPSP